MSDYNTTIKKFLNEWELENIAIEEVEEVYLPESIESDGVFFIRKVWVAAREQANSDVQSERDAIKLREKAVEELLIKDVCRQLLLILICLLRCSFTHVSYRVRKH